MLWRDLFVTGRELPVFLAQVLLQPLFLLFVFGKVLDRRSARPSPATRTLLFPGIVALTAVLTSLQGTALPLVLDFSFSREIEDRLLAPMPIMLVAVEKMVFATLRGARRGGGDVPARATGSSARCDSHAPPVSRWWSSSIVLGSLLGAAIGMMLGTFVAARPDQHHVRARPDAADLHRVHPVPVAVAGAASAGSRSSRVLNPLTYVSEIDARRHRAERPHLQPGDHGAGDARATVLFGRSGCSASGTRVNCADAAALPGVSGGRRAGRVARRRTSR